jgi:molybdopterin biosynthesis enzyme
LVAGGVDKAIRGVEGASDHAPAWISLKLSAAIKKTARRESNVKNHAQRDQHQLEVTADKFQQLQRQRIRRFS